MMKFLRLISLALLAISSAAYATNFTVTPSPANMSVAPGGTVAFNVNLTTPDTTTNGMGVRIHYASGSVTPVLSNLFATALLGAAPPAAETGATDDGDAATDMQITVSWADLGGNWPGASPVTLFRVTMTAAAGFAGSTPVNFTLVPSAGDSLSATSATIAAAVTVPDVSSTHPTQAAAQAALIAAGLTVGTVTTQASATVAVGHIISQSPAAGATVAGGSPVNLVRSSGPIAVPNVIGNTEAAAVAAINAAGLSPSVTSRPYSNVVAAGRVITQSPAGGVNVGPGATVQLAVSRGPAPVGGGATGVPTLSQWALILLAMLVGLVAWKRHTDEA